MAKFTARERIIFFSQVLGRIRFLLEDTTLSKSRIGQDLADVLANKRDAGIPKENLDKVSKLKGHWIRSLGGDLSYSPKDVTLNPLLEFLEYKSFEWFREQVKSGELNIHKYAFKEAITLAEDIKRQYLEVGSFVQGDNGEVTLEQPLSDESQVVKGNRIDSYFEHVERDRILPKKDFKHLDDADLLYLKGDYNTFGIEEETRFEDEYKFYMSKIRIDEVGAEIWYKLKDENKEDPYKTKVHLLSIEPYNYYFLWLSDWPNNKPFHLFGFVHKPNGSSDGFITFISPSEMNRPSTDQPYGGFAVMLRAKNGQAMAPSRSLTEKQALQLGVSREYINYLKGGNLPIVMPTSKEDWERLMGPQHGTHFKVTKDIEGEFIVYGIEEEVTFRGYSDDEICFFYSILTLSDIGNTYWCGAYDHSKGVRPEKIYKGPKEKKTYEYAVNRLTLGIVATTSESDSHLTLSIGDVQKKEIPFSGHSFLALRANPEKVYMCSIGIGEIPYDPESVPTDRPPKFAYAGISCLERITQESEFKKLPGRGLSYNGMLARGVSRENLEFLIKKGKPILDV